MKRWEGKYYKIFHAFFEFERPNHEYVGWKLFVEFIYRFKDKNSLIKINSKIQSSINILKIICEFSGMMFSIDFK